MPSAVPAPAPSATGRTTPEEFIPIALDGSPRYQHQHTSQFLPLRHRHALLSLEGLLVDATGTPVAPLAVSPSDVALLQQMPPAYTPTTTAHDPGL